MNAGRRYLNQGDLSGKVFLTSGLGGMSGAQAKASVVAGCVGVIAEVWVCLAQPLSLLTCVFSLQVSKKALLKRHEQGYERETHTQHL